MLLTEFSSGIKSIQRGVIALGATATSATATITAVVTAKTELRFLGSTGYSDTGVESVRIALTNSTTITANRESYSATFGNVVAAVSWELTEFY